MTPGISLTLDYFMMLIAMTFNIGFFCAVIGGYVLGSMVFGHVLENYGAILHHERRVANAKVIACVYACACAWMWMCHCGSRRG